MADASVRLREGGPSVVFAEPQHVVGIVQRHLEVPDPFVDETQRDRIDAECARLARIGRSFYGTDRVDARRKRTSRIDRSNPATAEMLASYPSFGAWLDLVPHAAALDVLYAPGEGSLPNGAVVDRASQLWFENVADAVGIRSRAAVMKDALRAEAARTPDRQQRWLSLACGAAQPVLEVLGRLGTEGRRVPNVTLVDLDRKALALAQSYARRDGVDQHIRTRTANVLRRRGLHGLFARDFSARPRRRSIDVVDAVGLLEYLKPHDWVYRYHGVVDTRRRLAGAITFLRNAYELVAPGGLLIVGNMLDTHPQLGFTIDVIQWPHIQPRSVQEMSEIFAAAGIDGEIEASIPADGVYAIYTIRRPLA